MRLARGQRRNLREDIIQMKRHISPRWFLPLFALTLPIATLGYGQTVQQRDGTLRLPQVDLPLSSLESSQTRETLRQLVETPDQADYSSCGGDPDAADIAKSRRIRDCRAEMDYRTRRYQYVRATYPVKIEPRTIGGVYTESFVPTAGVTPENRNRVLLNVHGGSFINGSRSGGRMEGIPIAAVGRVEVISIDYRMGPEYRFPAASEDVAAVYRQLLKRYKPNQIGIFGCSAGGLLTAESIAWFEREGLPLPGAVAMLCTGAAYWMDGDSGRIYGFPQYLNFRDNPYLKGVREDDPLAFPIRSDAVLAKFPPSLLVGGTRDFGLSSIVATHSRLVALGVASSLHVFEGMDHGFQGKAPQLSESREVYRLVAQFFSEHLSR